jgi:hypothetical protein
MNLFQGLVQIWVFVQTFMDETSRYSFSGDVCLFFKMNLFCPNEFVYFQKQKCKLVIITNYPLNFFKWNNSIMENLSTLPKKVEETE